MKRTLIIATVVSLAAGSTAWADHHGGGKRPGMMMKMMEMDANKDGVISKDEFQSHHQSKFGDADANKDGKVSKTEFIAHWEREEAKRKQMMQDRMFSRLDADGDGVVTEAEFAAHGDKAFGMMDRNKDGQLSKEDRRQDGHDGHMGGHMMDEGGQGQ